METQKIKKLPKPKYQIDDFGRVEGCFQRLKQNNLIDANKRLLQRNLDRGFNPEWYVVIHFNDGGGNKQYQKRRLDPHSIDEDVLAVKLKLFQLLYGRGWERMRKRSRSYWTVEYGNSCTKPHLNLLIEALPQGWNDKAVLEVLFNKLLPYKTRCLWSNSAKVQKIYTDPMICLNHYVNKESEMALRHQLQRRADLTNQNVISLLKHYAKEGIKNDPILKMYSI